MGFLHLLLDWMVSLRGLEWKAKKLQTNVDCGHEDSELTRITFTSAASPLFLLQKQPRKVCSSEETAGKNRQKLGKRRKFH